MINVNSRFSKKKIELNFKKTLILYNYVFFASQHMIKIEINQIMKFDKRFSTLQKWVKSKAWCKKYCTLKFFAHQIQRNKMFFVFVAFSIVLCSISSNVKFEMIFSFKDCTQNKCENDNLSVFVIHKFNYMFYRWKFITNLRHLFYCMM